MQHLSESAIQDLACLTYASKVFVKFHQKSLLNRIHKVGAIIIIYTITIHYLIAENARKHVHCRSLSLRNLEFDRLHSHPRSSALLAGSRLAFPKSHANSRYYPNCKKIPIPLLLGSFTWIYSSGIPAMEATVGIS
jgi:hypothetical protein